MIYIHRVPPRKIPKDDNGYFEILSQAVFQAGFSWEVVRRKWPNFRKAFKNFDVAKVTKFTHRDVKRLVNDPSIIRNTHKILAVVENAHLFRDIQKEYGSFRKYILATRKLDYPKRRNALVKTFRFIGPTGAYHFFWCVGERVPEWEERFLD